MAAELVSARDYCSMPTGGLGGMYWLLGVHVAQRVFRTWHQEL